MSITRAPPQPRRRRVAIRCREAHTSHYVSLLSPSHRPTSSVRPQRQTRAHRPPEPSTTAPPAASVRVLLPLLTARLPRLALLPLLAPLLVVVVAPAAIPLPVLVAVATDLVRARARARVGAGGLGQGLGLGPGPGPGFDVVACVTTKSLSRSRSRRADVALPGLGAAFFPGGFLAGGFLRRSSSSSSSPPPPSSSSASRPRLGPPLMYLAA